MKPRRSATASVLGGLALLCAMALALNVSPVRGDSNITLTPADIARADSIKTAKQQARALLKQQQRDLKRLEAQAAKEQANPNATPSNVTSELDSLAARMSRSKRQPAPLEAKPPKQPRPTKVKRPKVNSPRANEVAKGAPAPVAPKGVASGPATPLPRTLTPLQRQTSDRVITGDLEAIDRWQAKLDALPGDSADVWRAAAAREWLKAAREEYTDNDRQGFAPAAFERGIALITDIERGAAPVDSANAPPALIPRGSVKVADSLYTQLESLKHNPGFRCAREPLAQLEVELAWTGNEQIDQGDCLTSPHLERARELARTAQQRVEQCVPPLVAHPAEPEVPVPTDTMRVVHTEVPTREELRIPRNVHFALNEFDINPTSHRVISGIAALLAKYPRITVRMVGHADSRGSVAYNLELSKRRVNAARADFIGMGIDSSRLATDYKGKSNLYALESSKKDLALNRRVEMVFVDSEGRDITGEAQEGDLQIENAHSSKPKFTVPGDHPAPVKPPLKRVPSRKHVPARSARKPVPAGSR